MEILYEISDNFYLNFSIFKFKGEIELAQEALLAYERTETALQRTKKQYQQSVDHLAKAKFKQEKAASDPTVNARTKSQVLLSVRILLSNIVRCPDTPRNVHDIPWIPTF